MLLHLSSDGRAGLIMQPLHFCFLSARLPYSSVSTVRPMVEGRTHSPACAPSILPDSVRYSFPMSCGEVRWRGR